MKWATSLVLGLLAIGWLAAPASASWGSSGSGSASAASTTIAAPSGLVAACPLLLSNKIEARWTASTSTWAGYEVRWGTSAGNYPNSSGTLAAGTTAYTITVGGGGTYYVVVRAVQGTNWKSGFSNQDSVRFTFLLGVPTACT